MKERSLDFWIDELKNARGDLEILKDYIGTCENAILTSPNCGVSLHKSGITRVGNIKITTGHTRKWDQKKLTAFASEIQESMFPFKAEWKEDRRASRVIEERFPELAKKLESALTLTPRKPVIEILD